jgi:hypothetical protein
LLSKSRNTVQENTIALLQSSKGAGLEVNTTKSESGKYRKVKTGNKAFKNVAKFKYFGKKPSKSKLQSSLRLD